MKITYNNIDTYFIQKGDTYFNADRMIENKMYYIELWNEKRITDELLKEVSKLSCELYKIIGSRYENSTKEIRRYGDK